MRGSKIIDKQVLKSMGIVLADVTLNSTARMTSPEGKAIGEEIKNLLVKTLTYLDQQIEKKL